jgi:hypothetical protein
MIARSYEDSRNQFHVAEGMHMRWSVLALVMVLAIADVAIAGRYFAEITAVNTDKGTVDYTITFGKKKDTRATARVAKDCAIKEGYYRLGKPAHTKEFDDIAGGLKNARFKKATPENPVRVNIYTADADDAEKGIRAGDVIKILVNPPPKLK